LGWRWSVASERHGIPIGWAIDGANRNDVRMLEPTLDAIADTGLLVDIGMLHLDRGYDSGAVRQRLRGYGLDEFDIQRRGTKMPGVKKQPLRLGLRWVVEATTPGVELRATPPQHRPPRPTPTRRPLPRHHRAHRRPTPHLARPLEPSMTPIRSAP
jgi:hypothetical protein